MPGINLIFNWNAETEGAQVSLFSKAQSLIKHNQNYKEEILFKNGFCILGCTKYESYPLYSFDSGDFKIVVEGMIYNKDKVTIKSELSDIALMLDSDSGGVGKEIENWILNSDGEYNVIFLEYKKQKLFFINDTLGRLPLYYYSNDDLFILSRDTNFITQFMDKITFDKDTLAEYILFAAPLEDKTIISGIRRIPASTIMTASRENKNLSFRRIHMFNLDQRKYAFRTVRENALELKRIFIESCKDRYNSLRQITNVLSLSGGLDSRSVALGLKNINASFFAATFVGCEKKHTKNSQVARIIAKKLGLPWRLYKLPEPGVQEIECYLQYKGGLNNVGMSYLLNYFNNLMADFGPNTAFWTGDEGNASIGYNMPLDDFPDIDGLVEYIILRLGQANLDRVGILLNFDTQQIKDRIKKIVQGYPEKDLRNRFYHFLFFEYLYKAQYEGEEKNRVFFWSVAPFYSIFFIDYVLNVPDEQKMYHQLYKEFLIAFSPEIARVKNPTWGYPITAKGTMHWRWKRLLDSINEKMFTYYLHYPVPKVLRNYMTKSLENSAVLSKTELVANIKTHLLSKQKVRKTEFDNVLTLTSLINKMEREFTNKCIEIG